MTSQLVCDLLLSLRGGIDKHEVTVKKHDVAPCLASDPEL